jgi:hypothetical protein
MIIQLPFSLPFNIGAVTIFPFIIIAKGCGDDITVMHEGVHYMQQRNWFRYGIGIGLLLWFFVYIFVLPCYWNPFRRKWETEAYSHANGYDADTIDMILGLAPYWLKREHK